MVVRREESTGKVNNRGLLIVMIFLLLAGYTKQLAYATVGAAFVFLFLRQKRRAVIWAIAFAAVTAAVFLLINVATDGHWLTNTVTANINPFIPGQGIGLFRQWFELHIVLTIVAVLLTLYQLYFERLSAYAVWFAFAAANGVTAGKWGAGESYFATAIAASCILTGLAFGRFVDFGQARGRVLGLLSVSLVGVLFLLQADRLFHMPTHTPFLSAIAEALGKPSETHIAPQTSCSEPRPAVAVPYVDSAGVGLLGRPPTKADTEAGALIASQVEQGNTPAFSEEAGFNFYVDRDVITNPTQLLNLYNNNQVDLTEMLSMLDEQVFDTVIFRAQFYPPPVLEMIGDRYETVDLVEMNGFVYCLLAPKEPDI
jgi:hypothetical protein